MPWQTTWIDYECAYCTNICTTAEAVICKYGLASVYKCPVHGKYYVIDSPIHRRGDVIAPLGDL